MIIFAHPLFSQKINSLSISPASPTEKDTIYVYANCTFSSSDCPPYMKGAPQSGNTFQGYAIHCLGMLAATCTYTDTFKINPLPFGKYSFIFSLNEGQGDPPCTPGIVAGPTDTMAFTVSPTTGINRLSATADLIYPNPSSDKFYLSKIAGASHINVYNLLGELVHEQTFQKEINLYFLSRGIYFMEIQNHQKEKLRVEKIILKN